jgi:hypothetical protein
MSVANGCIGCHHMSKGDLLDDESVMWCQIKVLRVMPDMSCTLDYRLKDH